MRRSLASAPFRTKERFLYQDFTRKKVRRKSDISALTCISKFLKVMLLVTKILIINSTSFAGEFQTDCTFLDICVLGFFRSQFSNMHSTNVDKLCIVVCCIWWNAPKASRYFWDSTAWLLSCCPTFAYIYLTPFLVGVQESHKEMCG